MRAGGLNVTAAVYTSFLSLSNKELVILVSLSILLGRRERLKQCQSSQDSLQNFLQDSPAPWSLDAEIYKKIRKIFFV